MKTIGVIPARWASTRLAGKILADIHGKPMIQHVWERAKKSRLLDEVFLACDDEKVYQAIEAFGAQAVMTSPSQPSGTDRIAEAAQNIDTDIVLNIQGDEPLIRAEVIDALAQCMLDDDTALMATVVKVMDNENDINNPNVVKTVLDQNKNALYFSRSAIPFNRENKAFNEIVYYKHLGLYAYRKEFLLNFKNLPPSVLEDTEKLEQLRVVQAGYKIKTVETKYDTVSVDTAEDLERVKNLIKQEEKNA